MTPWPCSRPRGWAVQQRAPPFRLCDLLAPFYSSFKVQMEPGVFSELPWLICSRPTAPRNPPPPCPRSPRPPSHKTGSCWAHTPRERSWHLPTQGFQFPKPGPKQVFNTCLRNWPQLRHLWTGSGLGCHCDLSETTGFHGWLKSQLHTQMREEVYNHSVHTVHSLALKWPQYQRGDTVLTVGAATIYRWPTVPTIFMKLPMSHWILT